MAEPTEAELMTAQMTDPITHERAREIALKSGTTAWDGYEMQELLDYVAQQEKLDSARPEPFDDLVAWVERARDRRVEVVRTEVPDGNDAHEWNVRIEAGDLGWSADAAGCTELAKAARKVLGEAAKEGFT